MAFRICMVCLGNICRSPMAAAVLRHKLATAGLGDEVVVESAGTGGWHVGDGADRRARAALVARGYDDAHAARKFARAFFDDYDLVIAMDVDNLRNLRALAPDAQTRDEIRLLRSYDPAAPEGAVVEDPYYGGDDGFAEVLDQIERACDGLVAELVAELKATG
ncbi:MAG TPA: low molecular weight protein-tyrosine-phosphatase [Sporichthya sp.]|jgi:protein-tyrosine phosphatase|nr:low molecular weight protein-tyrosine-phosphatase [Sporichthya sp.]